MTQRQCRRMVMPPSRRVRLGGVGTSWHRRRMTHPGPRRTDLDPADWRETRALGHRMLDDMLDWLEGARGRPVWEQMPAEKQQVLTAKIFEEAKSGDMPPLQYRLLHWNAQLSKTDVQALSRLGKSTGGSEAALAGDGDAVQGKAVFEKRCTGCHAMAVDREGPRLAGVYGRRAGNITGFTYSAGLKNSGVTWNDATLEKWLSDPDLMVPDNNMSFSVPKAEERRNLIAYLKQ